MEDTKGFFILLSLTGTLTYFFLVFFFTENKCLPALKSSGELSSALVFVFHSVLQS